MQRTRRTVVVGVDGSDSALRAVRWGAAEAGRRAVPLRLVIACGAEADHIVHPQLAHRYWDTLRARARADLAEAAVLAEQAVPGVEVEQQLIVGHPILVLGEEAHRAQIVVVGDRGLGSVEGLLVGSVAVTLAAHASCPVVVVRGTDREPSETARLPVVVGIDGSAMSEAATDFAFAAAAARGVPVVAVHTWWDLMANTVLAPMLDWDAIEADERRLLSDRLLGWVEKYPDVAVEQIVVRNRPALILLEVAAGAQLVVVGSRGRGGFSGLVLGSVSHALLHRCPCPVAVVRPDTARPPV